jgi:hypothetical protein
MTEEGSSLIDGLSNVEAMFQSANSHITRYMGEVPDEKYLCRFIKSTFPYFDVKWVDIPQLVYPKPLSLLLSDGYVHFKQFLVLIEFIRTSLNKPVVYASVLHREKKASVVKFFFS